MERKNSRTCDKNGVTSPTVRNGGLRGATTDKGEFDDLISALRTGDVFGEDMAKMKRSRKGRQGDSLVRDDSRERTVISRH